MILLGEIDGFPSCEKALERLLAGLTDDYVVAERATSKISASVGVTLYPHDDVDADTLLRHADHAMYLAKEGGRGRYHIFDSEENRNLQLRRQTLARIACALRDEELTMYYQPKVNMRTGEVLGAEALLRWNDPERGLVPPLEFLPLVENDDLSIDIGAWVLGEVLRQQSCWLADGIEIKVSINISGRHLQQPGFASELERLLRTHPEVPPTLIELEVLETTALSDIARVSEIIGQCRALGVTVSLDDFGTGYSSLTYLRRLPADTLKIDCSFVRDMLADPEDLAIVEAIIGLSEAFQRQVIAEGSKPKSTASCCCAWAANSARDTALRARCRPPGCPNGSGPTASQPAGGRSARALPAPGPAVACREISLWQPCTERHHGPGVGPADRPRRQFCSRQANSVTGTATRAARYGALDEFRAVDEAHAALHRLLDAVRLPGAGCARQDAAVMAKRLRDRLEALEQRLLALEHRLDRSASETPARTRHSRALPRRRSTLSSRRAFRTRARR